jgi:hypothetical protein
LGTVAILGVNQGRVERCRNVGSPKRGNDLPVDLRVIAVRIDSGVGEEIGRFHFRDEGIDIRG